MSSPRQMTSGSRSISSKSPWRMASRYVVSAIVRPPARRALVAVDRGPDTLPIPERRHLSRIGVDAPQRVRRLRRRRGFRLVGGSVDLAGDPDIDPFHVRGRNTMLLGELADVAIQRIVLAGPAFDLAGGYVGLIVVLRVALPPVGHE